MRYFHRTSAPPVEVLEEADSFLGARLEQVKSGDRLREYRGNIGLVSVKVEAEGGHYTLITVETDRVGESEVDKLAKRYLARVHTRVDAKHQLRGAY